MATMKTLNGYGFNATEFNGKAASDYLQKNDTATNSAKLGGKAPEYYLQPRNLLDNSDFRNPVNQRGQTSYSGIWAYSIDRWATWRNTSNPGTVSVVSGGITVSFPGMVAQRIESKYIDSSKIYTFAAMTGDGLLVLSGKITSTTTGTTNANNGIYFNYLPNSGLYQFMLSAATSASKFVWAALYEGSYTADTLPPYVPKGYAAELAECQRYYQIIRLYRYLSALYDNEYRYYGYSLPVKMRVKPAVTIEFMEECKVNSFSKNTLKSYSGGSYDSFEGMSIWFNCRSELGTMQSQCYVSTKIACSADL